MLVQFGHNYEKTEDPIRYNIDKDEVYDVVSARGRFVVDAR